MKFILIWVVINSGGIPATGSEVFANRDSCNYAAARVELLARVVDTTCAPYDLVELVK